MKIFLGVLLIAHGLVHAGLAAAPNPADPDARPLAFFTTVDRSWLFSRIGLNSSTTKWIGIVLVILAVLGFVLAGIGILSSSGLNTIWRPCATFSSIVSVLLLVLFWHRWLPVGILINIVTLAVIFWNKFPEF